MDPQHGNGPVIDTWRDMSLFFWQDFPLSPGVHLSFSTRLRRGFCKQNIFFKKSIYLFLQSSLGILFTRVRAKKINFSSSLWIPWTNSIIISMNLINLKMVCVFVYVIIFNHWNGNKWIKQLKWMNFNSQQILKLSDCFKRFKVGLYSFLWLSKVF